MSDYVMFDPHELQPDVKILPNGRYRVVIVGAEHFRSRSDDVGLKMTVKVISGEYREELITNIFWVRHSSPKAQQLGRHRLTELCDALGIQKLEHPRDVMSREIEIEVNQWKDRKEQIHNGIQHVIKPTMPPQLTLAEDEIDF